MISKTSDYLESRVSMGFSQPVDEFEHAVFILRDEVVFVGAVVYRWSAARSTLRGTAAFFDSSVALSDRSKYSDTAFSFCNLSHVASLAGSRKDSFDCPVFLFTLERIIQTMDGV